MSAAKTALLVVDVQRGILAIPNLTRKKEIDQALDETVLRIAGLIERARPGDIQRLSDTQIDSRS
jgi:nicotinamidase-related amidase